MSQEHTLKNSMVITKLNNLKMKTKIHNNYLIKTIKPKKLEKITPIPLKKLKKYLKESIKVKRKC